MSGHYACVLPALPRALVIPKGRDGLFCAAVSRNGRVLFLSRRPLDELAGREVVLRVAPWPGRRAGTIVQVRERPPLRGSPVAATAHVGEPVESAAVSLALTPAARLALVPAEPYAQREGWRGGRSSG